MINLEQVLTGDAVERNFNRLRSLVIDAGGQSVGIRFGTASVIYGGVLTSSNNLTVTHGLATTPVAVFTQSQGLLHVARPTTVGITTFIVNTQTVDGSVPALNTTVAVYWLVIG